MLKKASKQVGLKRNISKTQVMTNLVTGGWIYINEARVAEIRTSTKIVEAIERIATLKCN